MRSDLFILLYLAVPLLANHTLLEFREISTIKLIHGHTKFEILSTDVFGEIQVLMSDIQKFDCTSDECENERNKLNEALDQKNKTLRGIFNADSEVLTRKKRSWDPLGKSLKWMGGVMDADDREGLNNRVNILYENQKLIYDRMESLLSKPEALKAENAKEFNEIEKELKHVQELINFQSYRERFEQISIVIDGIWRTFFTKKIDGIFVTSHALEKIKDMPQLACEKIADCIKNADAEVELENSKISINLRIPKVTEHQLKLYEIISKPSDLDSHIILLKLPQKYFGYDEQNKKLIALIDKNLISCKKSDESSVMYCRAEDIVQNINTDECLEKAFRDKIVDSDACASNMELLQSSGFGVVDIGKGDFWVHTRTRRDMSLFCGKNDREIKTFTRSEIFHLTFGCHAVFSANGIDLTSYVSDDSVRLKSIRANISKSDFVDVVETMVVSQYMRDGFLMSMQNYQPKGLTLQPIEIENEPQVRSYNADELKTIKAQHNEALVVVAIFAVAFMLFIALKGGKTYILRHISQKQRKSDEEQDAHESEENNLNEKKNVIPL